MKQVIVFPRGQLSEKDRKSIARAGCVIVEADDPSKVVTILPGVPLVSADAMLVAALQALSGATFSAPRDHFVKLLSKLAKKQHAKAEEQPR